MLENRSPEFAEMMGQFARQVLILPYEASSITIFSEMPINDKMEAYIGGVMVGLMMALREQVKSEDSMQIFQDYIAGCLPVARMIAEDWQKATSTDG